MTRSRDELSEALVARLRNKKRRIVCYSVTIALLILFLAVQWHVLSSMSAAIVPKQGEDLLLHVVTTQPLCMAISVSYATMLLVGAACAKFVVSLIVEVAGYSTNELIVQLWDRVKALERLQEEGGRS